MRATLITDEITQNVVEIIFFCKNFALEAIELRTLNGKHILDFRESEIIELYRKLNLNGLRIICIDTPIFKCELDSDMIDLSTEFFRQATIF